MNTNTHSLATMPAKSTIKPKPTKTEIITAMATLHIQQLEQKNKEVSERQEVLQGRIQKLMIDIVKKDGFKTLPSNACTGSRWGEDQEIRRVQLEIDFPMSPDSPLTKLLHEYHDLRTVRVPELKDACKFIRDRMENRAGNEERVQQLLTDKESRKALDAALEAIQ